MCKAESDRIKLNMNPNADPCDDFYDYVCGGYASNHTLPDDKGRYGTFDAVDENVSRRLREMYSVDYVQKEIVPLKFVRKMFNACNDTSKYLFLISRSTVSLKTYFRLFADTLEGRGVDSLLQVLESFGGWPLANNNTGYNESGYNFFEAFSHVVGKLGSNILLNVVVYPDPKNTSNYIITVSSYVDKCRHAMSVACLRTNKEFVSC